MGDRSELNFEEAVFGEAVYHESDYLEVPASRWAFIFSLALAFIASVAVIAQVGFLILAEGESFKARASANVTREISLPTYRALILDRYGSPIAENKRSFSAYISAQVLYQEGDWRGIIGNLEAILGIDQGVLVSMLLNSDFGALNWIPVERNITPSEAIAIKGLNSKAIQVIDDYEREYPRGPAFAHVIGYTGVGSGGSVVGKSGIELAYDEYIKGKNGRYVFYEDALGEVLNERALSEAEPSAPLYTTIDAGLQDAFYKSLGRNLRILGRDSGAGIAINPKNGEVLALVNFPSFDNNVFVDRSLSKERASILNKPSQPLFNRSVSGLYSPGSTIKPLVALAALREAVAHPADKVFSRGKLEIPNPYFPESPSVFVDWKAHGWVDMASAIARSSNIYFYLLGGGLPDSVPSAGLIDGDLSRRGLGAVRLKKYWQFFGFGKETGLDIPYEESGFLPDPEEKESRTGDPWRLGDTYNISIGQGDLLVTPLQLVNFIASIANGGIIYKPHLLKKENPEILVDYSTWVDEISVVKKGMEDAVQKPYGTARILGELTVSSAGKTGTPQIANNARVNAFFAGYMPAHDPELAILVLVENAREGSLNALPIAKDVFSWYQENRLGKTVKIIINQESGSTD